MEELGRFAMDSCIDFIRGERHMWPLPPFLEDFQSAVTEIGIRWPNGKLMLSGKVDDIGFKGHGHQIYPELEAAVLRDRSRIEALACHTDEIGVANTHYMRVRALVALLRWWPDDQTRQFLCQRAVDDEDPEPRAKALELLASDERWAEHKETLTVRQHIKDAIRDATEPEQRGKAAWAWFGSAISSDPLADAKKRVFRRKALNFGAFLDPREPVSDEHLAIVASYADLSDEQRDEMVEQMNATLGWDIRRGLLPEEP